MLIIQHTKINARNILFRHALRTSTKMYNNFAQIYYTPTIFFFFNSKNNFHRLTHFLFYFYSPWTSRHLLFLFNVMQRRHPMPKKTVSVSVFTFLIIILFDLITHHYTYWKESFLDLSINFLVILNFITTIIWFD